LAEVKIYLKNIKYAHIVGFETQYTTPTETRRNITAYVYRIKLVMIEVVLNSEKIMNSCAAGIY